METGCHAEKPTAHQVHRPIKHELWQ